MESRPPSTSGPPSTTTIPGLFVSGAGDAILGLRVYGTGALHPFPSDPWERLRVANDGSADVFINDPSISRRGSSGFGHASIRRQNGSLIVSDEGSKNGTQVDGARRAVFELKPGSVVTFGAVSMVAVSKRTEAMRVRLMRFLGFGEPHLMNVEHALYAAIRRLHLIAHSPPGGVDRLSRIIHDIAPGDAWPRYVVDDRVLDDAGAQRALLRRSRLGTLVMPAEFWPANPATLRDAMISPTREHRLLFVVPRAEPNKPARPAEQFLGRELRDLAVSIDVPTLTERGPMEIDRTIHAGVQEYGVPLGLPGPVFSPAELARLTGASWRGNAEELDEMVQRVTRVRLVGIERAAELEQIDAESVRRWMKRHKFPTKLPTT